MDLMEQLRRHAAGKNLAARTSYPSERKKRQTRWSDAPSEADMVARAFSLYGDDHLALDGVLRGIDTEVNTPGSPIYNPYRVPTNAQYIDQLGALGVDVSGGINDDFFAQNAELNRYLAPSATSGAPSKPGEKSTPQEQAAYAFYQLGKDEATTQKAEREWANMQKELRYWSGRGVSDEDAIALVDASSDYPTLTKMREAAKLGAPIPLNRAVGYSADAQRGVLWAARNGDESEDYFASAVRASMGEGKHYTADPERLARMDVASPDYHPYLNGSTMHADNIRFGVNSYDKNWLNENKSLAGAMDADERNAYLRVYAAEKGTEEAKAERDAVYGWIDAKLAQGLSPEQVEADLRTMYDSGSNEIVPMRMLRRMDDGRMRGKPIDLTDTVDWRLEDAISYIKDAGGKVPRAGIAQQMAGTQAVQPSAPAEVASGAAAESAPSENAELISERDALMQQYAETLHTQQAGGVYGPEREELETRIGELTAQIGDGMPLHKPYTIQTARVPVEKMFRGEALTPEERAVFDSFYADYGDLFGTPGEDAQGVVKYDLAFMYGAKANEALVWSDAPEATARQAANTVLQIARDAQEAEAEGVSLDDWYAGHKDAYDSLMQVKADVQAKQQANAAAQKAQEEQTRADRLAYSMHVVDTVAKGGVLDETDRAAYDQIMAIDADKLMESDAGYSQRVTNLYSSVDGGGFAIKANLTEETAFQAPDLAYLVRDYYTAHAKMAASVGMTLDELYAQYPALNMDEPTLIQMAKSELEAKWTPTDPALAAEGLGFFRTVGMGVEAGWNDFLAGKTAFAEAIVTHDDAAVAVSNYADYVAQYGLTGARSQYIADVTAAIADMQDADPDKARYQQMLADAQASDTDVFLVPFNFTKEALASARGKYEQRSQENADLVMQYGTRAERDLLFPVSRSATSNSLMMGEAAAVSLATGSPMLGTAVGFGLPQFGQTTLEGVERGLPIAQARLLGGADMAVTMALESPMLAKYMPPVLRDSVGDATSSVVRRGGAGFVQRAGQAVKQLGRNAVEEGVQEVTENLASGALRAAAYGDASEFTNELAPDKLFETFAMAAATSVFLSGEGVAIQKAAGKVSQLAQKKTKKQTVESTEQEVVEATAEDVGEAATVEATVEASSGQDAEPEATHEWNFLIDGEEYLLHSVEEVDAFIDDYAEKKAAGQTREEESPSEPNSEKEEIEKKRQTLKKRKAALKKATRSVEKAKKQAGTKDGDARLAELSAQAEQAKIEYDEAFSSYEEAKQQAVAAAEEAEALRREAYAAAKAKAKDEITRRIIQQILYPETRGYPPAQIEKENTNLGEYDSAVSATAEGAAFGDTLARLTANLSGEADRARLKRIVKQINEDMGHALPIDETANAMADALEKIGAAENQEEAKAALSAYQEALIKSVSEETGASAESKAFREHMRSTPIRLTDKQWQDAISLYGSNQAFKKETAGKLRVKPKSSTEGAILDDVWNDLAALFPGQLQADVAEAEQVTALLDAIDNTKIQQQKHHEAEDAEREGRNIATAALMMYVPNATDLLAYDGQMHFTAVEGDAQTKADAVFQAIAQIMQSPDAVGRLTEARAAQLTRAMIGAGAVNTPEVAAAAEKANKAVERYEKAKAKYELRRNQASVFADRLLELNQRADTAAGAAMIARTVQAAQANKQAMAAAMEEMKSAEGKQWEAREALESLRKSLYVATQQQAAEQAKAEITLAIAAMDEQSNAQTEAMEAPPQAEPAAEPPDTSLPPEPQPSEAPQEPSPIPAEQIEAPQQLGTKNGSPAPVRAPMAASMPQSTGKAGVRQFAVRAQQSKALSPETKKFLDEHKWYTKDSNHQQALRARAWMEDRGEIPAQMEWLAATDAEIASADGQARGVLLMQLAVNRKDVASEIAIADRYDQVGTFLAQGLQARTVFDQMSPAGSLAYTRRAAEKASADVLRRTGAKVDISISDATAQRIAEASTLDERQAAVDAAIAEINSQIPPTLVDKLNAFRYLAMLGNPATHARNIAGNLAFAPVVWTRDQVSAALQALGKRAGLDITPNRSVGLRINDEYREYAADRLNNPRVVQELSTGKRYESDSRMTTVTNEGRRSFGHSKVGDALQWASDKVSDALKKEDLFFKKQYYVRSLASYLQAHDVDLQNATPEVLEAAHEHALKDAQVNTFNNVNAGMRALISFENRLRGIGVSGRTASAVIEGVVPFKNATANITARALEYSPLGLVEALSLESVKLKKGEITANEWVDRVASGLTGTGIFALGMLLRSAGMIVGRVGDDDEGDYKKQKGEQDYSVYISVDGKKYSYTIDWMGPAAIPMFAGAQLYDVLSGEDDVSVVEAVMRVSEPVFSLTMLDGLDNTLNSLAYTEGKKPVAFVESALYSLAGQFVPTILGQIARTIDPVRRANTVDKNSPLPGNLQYFVNKAINRIPGASMLMPAYVDAWGEKPDNGNILMRAFKNFVSPGYISEIRDDDMTQLVERVSEASGDAAYPKKADKSIRVNGETIHLTPKQFEQVQTETGTRMQEIWRGFLTNEKFAALEPAYQAQALQDAFTYAQKQAQMKIAPDVSMQKWMQDISGDAAEVIAGRAYNSMVGDLAEANAKKIAKYAQAGDMDSCNSLMSIFTQIGLTDAQAKSKIAAEMKPAYQKAYRAGDMDACIAMETALMGLYIGFDDGDFIKWREAR